MWRDRDRFPVSTVDPGGSGAAQPKPSVVRPFGLRFVDYSPGRPRFSRPQVTLCPRRQVGVVDGLPASEVMPMAATMTSFESDGKDVLTVDWATDDK
ncbi:putative ATP-grasp-modified RiPP [Kribbella sp. NPDC050124]|uniref:putative ATP-grasp-modified RiPP n=1 Tax=Kribbella sp. NPDC050124 TaxID=3364114 RepID=UPI0037AB0445